MYKRCVANRLNDLWSISLTSLQATRITATSPIGARYFMAYTTNPVSGDFYIHGGWIGGSARKLTLRIIITVFNSFPGICSKYRI